MLAFLSLDLSSIQPRASRAQRRVQETAVAAAGSELRCGNIHVYRCR